MKMCLMNMIKNTRALVIRSEDAKNDAASKNI